MLVGLLIIFAMLCIIMSYNMHSLSPGNLAENIFFSNCMTYENINFSAKDFYSSDFEEVDNDP